MASADYVTLTARIKYHIQKAEFYGLKEAESTVLLKEAADAIEKLSMRLHGDEAAIAGMKREIERMVVSGNKPRWISVEERLPELCQNVLVSDGKESGEGWLDRYDWHDPNREDVVYTSPQPRDFWCIPGCKVDEDHVTHWMPLPNTEGLNET